MFLFVFLARDLAHVPITVVFMDKPLLSGSFVGEVGHAIINRLSILQTHTYIYIYLYIKKHILRGETRARSQETTKDIDRCVPVGVAQPTKSSKRRTWFLTMPPSQLVRRAAIGRKQCSCYMRCRKRGDHGDQSERKSENSGRNVSKMT